MAKSNANPPFWRRVASTSFLRRVLEVHGSIMGKLIEIESVVFAPSAAAFRFSAVEPIIPAV